MNRVRSLLSMRGMLFRYSFEPSPNSHVLATVSSVMTIGLSMKGCLHLKKPGWWERTRLPSPEVWVAATLKAWRDSGRAYLLPSSHNAQEDSKRLCLEDDTLRLPKKKGTNGPLLKQSVTLAFQICWLIQFLMKPLIIYLTTFWVLLLLSYTISGESIFNIIFHSFICSNSGFCWNWRNQS